MKKPDEYMTVHGIPQLNKIVQENKDKEITVIGMAMSPDGTESVLIRIKEKPDLGG